MDYLRCLSVSQEYINLILFFVKSKKNITPNVHDTIENHSSYQEPGPLNGDRKHRCQDGDDFDTGVT